MVIIQNNLYRLLTMTRTVGGLYTFIGGLVCFCATLALSTERLEGCLLAYKIGAALLLPGLLFLWLAGQLQAKRLWAFYGIALGGCFQILLAAILLSMGGRRPFFIIVLFCQLPAMCLLAYPDLRQLRRQQREQRDYARAPAESSSPAQSPASAHVAMLPPPPYRGHARR